MSALTRRSFLLSASALSLTAAHPALAVGETTPLYPR